ncbi:hypothetical protein POV27_09880 [Aureisphaera galaxeae]|uniref:hypothetical protein n=1 Tax=Aureisphaera galaxeae TaxID=1538023 RepID=UPI0023508FE2|nr:hypothetical protein [Aureisphaera galaxeae]MDC8004361.1 hypothetical protein [Aureisphaera galaxeae]
MKNAICFILLAVLCIACQNEPKVQPKYSNFETDLEERNLFGKVKSYDQRIARIEGGNLTSMKDPVLNLTEEFSENGALLKSESFDVFGASQQTIAHYFDDSEFLVKSVTINKQGPIGKTVQLIERDTINSRETIKVTLNDTMNYEFHSRFDASDRIAEQIKIEKGDTTVVRYAYEYDANQNLIRSTETSGEENTINTFTYDENGNMIESIWEADHFKSRTLTKYKDNRITEIHYYNIYPDGTEHLESITQYDEYYNPTNTKSYRDNELDNETKMEYELDDQGNWIKKKMYLKQHFAKSNEFVPISVENREITYWN